MSKYLLIRSRDRDSGSSHNFKMVLKNPLKDEEYELVSLIMPNGFYNVNNNNNKIYFNDGSDQTATLTNGNYSASSLATEIQTQMNAASSHSFTCTYSTATSKFTISDGTGNFSLKFATNTSASARYLLGFDESDTSATSSKISDNLIDISNPQMIFVNISQAGDNLRDTKNAIFADLFLPLDVSFGEMKYFKPGEEEKQTVKFVYTNNLEVYLRDENNDTVDLNGLEWSIVLKKI